jgi:hypothetical protein
VLIKIEVIRILTVLAAIKSAILEKMRKHAQPIAKLVCGKK